MIDKLAEIAYNSEYLNELIEILEKKYFEYLFDNKVCLDLDDKELNDILRFADVLASSSISTYKNLANRIVSLIYDFEESEKYYSYFCDIFIKLGLFINIQNNVNKETLLLLPDEINNQYYLKKAIQKDEYIDIVYTDSQYEVIQEISNSNHYSLSAPTSFGKTLLMMNQINSILHKNSNASFCLLVPTNALLREITDELRVKFSKINKKIRIINYPELSKIDLAYKNIIFVFTPERLNKYFELKNKRKIDYLFVDEAQNVIKENDVRTPLFYHVIELASYHSANIFFISPYVSNPKIFLELISKDSNYNKIISDRLVNQNKIIMDYRNKKISYFNYRDEKVNIDIPLPGEDDSYPIRMKKIISNIANDSGTIIYFSSKAKMISSLISMINIYDEIDDEVLKKFSKEIETTIHPKYILAESIKKGIAFHFGQLPKNTREKVEILFKEGHIKILFSTSTLLQGVNLPAKNIIVTSTKNGRNELSNLDLANLIGRAGRYGNSLNGNIIFLNNDGEIKEKTIL